MRKLLSILLIISLTIQTSSQLWIEAAFYLNRDYIAQNLCINRFDKIPVCKGSCFLEKELNENNKKEQKLLDLKIKNVDLYCDAITTTIEAPVIILPIPEKFLLLNQTLPNSLLSLSVFHPPCGIA